MRTTMTSAPATPLAAPFARQLAGWIADFALIVGVAALLAWVTHYRTTDYLSSWPELTQTGVRDVLGSRGDWGGAGKQFGTDVVRQVLIFVIQAFVALIVVTFAYRFVSLAWKGCTVGKMLADVRVAPRLRPDSGLGAWPAAARAFGSTMTDVGIYSIACIALLAGEFALSFVLWLVAVGVLTVNAVFLAGPGRRTLIDRLAGTVVIRAGRYQRSWDAARDNATVRRGISTARNGLGTAQSTTRAVRDQASQLADSDRLQHLLDSDRATQIRQRGRAVARHTGESARQALASERGQQARRAVDRFGTDVKNAYTKRRDGGDHRP